MPHATREECFEIIDAMIRDGSADAGEFWVVEHDEGGRVVGEPFPAPKDEKPLPQSAYSRGERCPQDFFDPVLRRFASQFPHVSLRYETELVDFQEQGDGVTVRLSNQKEIKKRRREEHAQLLLQRKLKKTARSAKKPASQT